MARAQYKLDKCCDKGQGVAQTFETAVELYTEAALQGDVLRRSAAWAIVRNMPVP
jgi:TPR repeat protein